jgi:16S rRNA (uracil1498-N3)-methyltransferase
MRRFFIDKKLEIGETALLFGDEARHIQSVLRMAPGDELILINGSGAEHTAVIKAEWPDRIELEVTGEALCAAEPVNRVTLFQCLPKAGKMELIIQKCVELGVNAVQPVYSKRYVVKPERNESKTQRYNKVAQEAAKQCGRSAVPKVHPVVNLKDTDLKAFDLVLVAYEDEDERTLKQTLNDFKCGRDQASEIAVLIGPEGGFEKEEVDLILKSNENAYAVTLGKRILRTETAGMALLAMLMYDLEG